MVFIFCLLFIAFVLPFIIVDTWLIFHTWQKRIHIGRWNDRLEWQTAIKKRACQYLNKAPTIPISDEKRLVLWDMIRGKYGHKNIQSWQYGGLILGLDPKEALLFRRKHDLSTYDSLDSAFLFYSLYKKGALSHEELISFANKTKLNSNDKTVPYRSFLPNIRFVDSIGLVLPFMAICGLKEKATNQIKEYDEALLEKTFPPHAYNIEDKLPLGIYDWGRGLGWYILGITECIELDNNKNRVINLAEKMLKYQHPNGGLGFMYFSKTHIESTGTALLGLLFLKAYEINHNNAFLEAAKKVERSLMKITRRDGSIDYAQGDTKGIGMYSNRFDIMPFAQGITLLFSKKLDNYSIN